MNAQEKIDNYIINKINKIFDDFLFSKDYYTKSMYIDLTGDLKNWCSKEVFDKYINYPDLKKFKELISYYFDDKNNQLILSFII